MTVSAVQPRGWNNPWGVEIKHEEAKVEGGAWHFSPVIRDWSDTAKLSWPAHEIDEAATAANVQKLGDAIGDLVPIHCERGPLCQGFMGDISMMLAQMRGLEQVMMDMCESPDELHQLLGWMRDGILANQAAAEAAGDMALTSQQNQCLTYCRELPRPQANSCGATRRQLWAYCAAQEFTGVSPAMHEEFLLRYQKPIIEQWGLSAYGCCEDLTTKIGILRQVKNLRIIAVSPRADLRRCVEQIGTDYVISWRPNPTDMVSYGFDEARIRRILREGLTVARGCHLHLNLKDIYTLEGDPGRLARWVKIAREAIASV